MTGSASERECKRAVESVGESKKVISLAVSVRVVSVSVNKSLLFPQLRESEGG